MESLKVILNLDQTTIYMEKSLKEAASHINEVVANRTGYGEDFDPALEFATIVNFNVSSRILRDPDAMREQLYEALMLLQQSEYCDVYRSLGTIAIVLGRESVAAMSIDIVPCTVFSSAEANGDFVSMACEAIPANMPYCTIFATAYVANAIIYTNPSVTSQVSRKLASSIVQILKPRISAMYQ